MDFAGSPDGAAAEGAGAAGWVAGFDFDSSDWVTPPDFVVEAEKSKRGHQLQKFQTSCEGGPSPRIGKTKSVSVEIELMPDGRNMTEYTYGSGGQIQYSRYIR